jgi:hypothetical protein
MESFAPQGGIRKDGNRGFSLHADHWRPGSRCIGKEVLVTVAFESDAAVVDVGTVGMCNAAQLFPMSVRPPGREKLDSR